MKLLTLSELNMIHGCGGGVVISPPPPPRDADTQNTDGSYTPPPKTEEGN
jgi:hypothetical protein